MAIYHHTFSIYDVAWSPDDRNLAVAEADGKITIWDTQMGLSQVIPNAKYQSVNIQIDWSETTGLIFASDTGIIGLGENMFPVARAGLDQMIVVENQNALATVTLNGQDSTDDVVIVDYRWTKDGIEIAGGITPTVNLPVGVHTLNLIVTDDDGDTHSDQVIITVASLTPGAGWIVFSANRDGVGQRSLYAARPTDSDAVRLTSDAGVIDRWAAWSPNREYIAFTREDSAGNEDIYIKRVTDNSMPVSWNSPTSGENNPDW